MFSEVVRNKEAIKNIIESNKCLKCFKLKRSTRGDSYKFIAIDKKPIEGSNRYYYSLEPNKDSCIKNVEKGNLAASLSDLVNFIASTDNITIEVEFSNYSLRTIVVAI